MARHIGSKLVPRVLSGTKLNGKKISTVEQIRKLTERKVNSKLWAEVKKLSKGTAKEKISAVTKIFEQHYNLPEESIEISKELANKNQPLEVRLQIADNLVKHENIPSGMHVALFEILVENKDKQINKIIAKSPIVELSKKVEVFLLPFFKQLDDFVKKNRLGKI